MVAAWLIGVTLIIWFFRTESIASDDLIYLNVARYYDGGRPIDGSIQVYARLAAWWSLRVGEWATGDALRAFFVMPLLASLASMWLAFRLAARRWGFEAGMAAAVSLSLCPLFLLYGSIWQPDVFAGAALLAALLVGMAAFVDESTPRARLRATLAGVLIAIGFSFKETSLLAGPGVLVFVILFRRRDRWAWRRMLWAMGGGAAVLLVEAATLGLMTGDPLFHWRSIVEGSQNYGSPLSGGSVVWYLAEYPRWLLDPSGHFGWWGPAACTLVAMSIFKANDDVRLLLCVLVVMLGYMTVGSINLLDYQPMFHQPRYLLVLLPLISLVIGATFGNRLRTRMLRFMLAALAFAIFIQAISHLDRRAGQPYAAGAFAAGRKIVDQIPPAEAGAMRWCASGQTAFRLQLLWEQRDWPAVSIVDPPPQDRESWLQRYRGAHVLVSDRDRRPDRAGVAALSPASLDALATFPRAMSAGPDISRITATLGWGDPREDDARRIDVFHITDQPQTHSARIAD